MSWLNGYHLEKQSRQCTPSKVGYTLSSPKYTGRMTTDAKYGNIAPQTITMLACQFGEI